MTKATFYYQNPDAPQPNKPLHVGVAAFVEKAGSVLLECRTDSGRWALIGGAIDMHESVHAPNQIALS